MYEPIKQIRLQVPPTLPSEYTYVSPLLILLSSLIAHVIDHTEQEDNGTVFFCLNVRLFSRNKYVQCQVYLVDNIPYSVVID